MKNINPLKEINNSYLNLSSELEDALHEAFCTGQESGYKDGHKDGYKDGVAAMQSQSEETGPPARPAN